MKARDNDANPYAQMRRVASRARGMTDVELETATAKVLSIAAERLCTGKQDPEEYVIGSKIQLELARRATLVASDEIIQHALDWWEAYAAGLDAAAMKRLAYADESSYVAMATAIREYAERHGLEQAHFYPLAVGFASCTAEGKEMERLKAAKATNPKARRSRGGRA